MRAGKWLTTGFAAVMASAVAVPTSADVYVVPPLDVQLINADALLFANVTSLARVADDEVDVTLADANVIATRWSEAKVWTFRVRGTLTYVDGRASVIVQHRAQLTVGKRYFMMLEGGSTSLAPFGPWGVNAVGDNGDVLCRGGAIYGLTPEGLFCAHEGDQVGRPLNESELGRVISTALQHARLRRPEMALESERNVHELPTTLTPRGAQ